MLSDDRSLRLAVRGGQVPAWPTGRPARVIAVCWTPLGNSFKDPWGGGPRGTPTPSVVAEDG